MVFDIGSAMFRAGYAGSAWPEINIPTSCPISEEKFVFDDHFIYNKPNRLPFCHLVNDQSMLESPDALTQFLNYSHERLGEPIEEGKSALFTQPAHMMIDPEFGKSWRTTIAESAFETLGYTNVSITSDALLAAYAHCYHTATVVDFGWSCVRIIPVVEGNALIPCSRFHICGGMVMSQMLIERLKQKSISIVDPVFGFSKQQVQMIENRTAADIIKESCSFTNDPEFSEPENLVSLNGRIIDVKEDMDVISQILFRSIGPDDKEKKGGEEEEDSSEIIPLHQLLSESIFNAPDKYKRALWSGIVTAGGFSTIQGFTDKLIADLKSDKTFEKKVNFPMHEMVAGDFSIWAGGSILASSPVFNRYCVSKADYQEYGQELIRIKCEGHPE